MDDLTKAIVSVAARILRTIGEGPAGHIVIVGGLLPTLLSEECSSPPTHAHQGTTDLDVVLSLALLQGETAAYYRSIVDALKELGFESGNRRHMNDKRWRWTGVIDDMEFGVDLLSAPVGQRPAGHPQPLPADGSAAGSPEEITTLGVTYAELAHLDRNLVTLTVQGTRGPLPDYTLPVAGLASWLALKTDAIGVRDRTKDAYDVVWLLRCLGVEEAARRVMASPLWDSEHAEQLREALSLLAKRFADADGEAAGSAAEHLIDAGLSDQSAAVERRRARDTVTATIDRLVELGARLERAGHDD